MSSTATAALHRVRASSLTRRDRAPARRCSAPLASRQVLPGSDAVPGGVGHRGDGRRHLRPHRTRVHARVRNPAADQLRARRRVRPLGAWSFSIITWLGLDTDTSVPVIVGGSCSSSGHDARVCRSERRDRARCIQAASSCSPARSVDHGGRSLVHPPKRRPRRVRAELPHDPRLHPADGRDLDPRRLYPVEQARRVRRRDPAAARADVVRSIHTPGQVDAGVAQDTDAAAMLGIDVNRTISVTFMLAGSLAAAAGLIYLLQFNMRYDTGFELGLIAFTAAVLGGIGNLPGAVLGAMVIGLVQAYNEGLDGLRAATGRGRSSSGSSLRRSSSGPKGSSASARRRARDLGRPCTRSAAWSTVGSPRSCS